MSSVDIALGDTEKERKGESQEKAARAHVRGHDSEIALRSIAKEYGLDAASERRSTTRLYALFVAMLISAIVISVTGAVRARHHRGFNSGEYAAYGATSLVVAVLAVYVGRQAEHRRIASEEAKRLERQLRGVDAYVELLPDETQALLRGAMLSRIFPRILGDDDPLREPPWPQADQLLVTIDPQLYRVWRGLEEARSTSEAEEGEEEETAEDSGSGSAEAQGTSSVSTHSSQGH
jgi:hypothetical protein